ncbi:hypothetical protein [Mycobacterium sp.]|uniref:hypothetical protein n=1 Tax=Mycobacterium sp. TaxID=1785 RepID=UPI00334189D6
MATSLSMLGASTTDRNVLLAALLGNLATASRTGAGFRSIHPGLEVVADQPPEELEGCDVLGVP